MTARAEVSPGEASFNANYIQTNEVPSSASVWLLPSRKQGQLKTPRRIRDAKLLTPGCSCDQAPVIKHIAHNSTNQHLSNFSMALISGEAIFGLYEEPQKPTTIDQSPVRLPRIIGNDELEDYQHRPIDAYNDIRLIELLPPRKASAERYSMEIIRCKVHSFALTQTPEYEGLSYACGRMSAQLPISIVVDDSNEEALFVTPQLIMALRRLRLPSKSRLLWIDQLSINQNDLPEKGLQIQLMGRIYNRASRVNIWLGEDPIHYVNEPGVLQEQDFQLIEGMLQAFGETSTATSLSDHALARSMVDVRPTYHVVNINQRRYIAIYELLNRQWFRRAWVFQEASQAREIMVYYGPMEVPIEKLKRVFDAVLLVEFELGIQGRQTSLASDTCGYEMIELIQRTRENFLQPSTFAESMSTTSRLLLTLLQVLRRVQATDPRDLIFAFLAYQNHEGIVATEESYKQSHEEIWLHAAECIIKTSQSLDIFAAVAGDKERKSTLPSWAPAWSDCFPYSRPIATPVSRFRASRGLPHVWKQNATRTKLTVRGKIVDRVYWFPTLAFRESFRWSYVSLFWSWNVIVDSTQRQLYAHSGSLGDQLQVRLNTLGRDLMRTLLADGAMGSEQPLRCVYEMLDSLASGDKAREFRSGGRARLNSEQIQILDEYEKLEKLARVSELKRLFLTDHLQLGMAASSVIAGDQIAIIHGSKVPCILREAGKGTGEYRVISQCYLDGWMYGKPPRQTAIPHNKWWEEEPDEFVIV